MGKGRRGGEEEGGEKGEGERGEEGQLSPGLMLAAGFILP